MYFRWTLCLASSMATHLAQAPGIPWLQTSSTFCHLIWYFHRPPYVHAVLRLSLLLVIVLWGSEVALFTQLGSSTSLNGNLICFNMLCNLRLPLPKRVRFHWSWCCDSTEKLPQLQHQNVRCKEVTGLSLPFLYMTMRRKEKCEHYSFVNQVDLFCFWESKSKDNLFQTKLPFCRSSIFSVLYLLNGMFWSVFTPSSVYILTLFPCPFAFRLLSVTVQTAPRSPPGLLKDTPFEVSDLEHHPSLGAIPWFSHSQTQALCSSLLVLTMITWANLT